MNDLQDSPHSGWFIRRKHFPIAAIVVCMTMGCIGVTGIYTGSTMQASRNDAEVDALKKQLDDQKIAYEKRLGTQSAAYAVDANNFGAAVKNFALALEKMDKKSDSRAANRERAQEIAIQAAKMAAIEAAATSKKTDQILKKQIIVQKQVEMAATAATAAEQKIDGVKAASSVASRNAAPSVMANHLNEKIRSVNKR